MRIKSMKLQSELAFTATLLEDIACHFDEMEKASLLIVNTMKQLKQPRDQQYREMGKADGYRAAAQLLRTTTIEEK